MVRKDRSVELLNYIFYIEMYDWTSRKNSLELIELSSVNKVSLAWVSSCNNTGSIRNYSY